MSYLIRRRGKAGSFELRIKHRVLPRPFYCTFSTEEDARAYAQQAERFLALGVVPEGLVAAPRFAFRDIAGAIRAYEHARAVPHSTAGVLATVSHDIGDTLLEKVDYGWAEAWVRTQKIHHHRSPGTIRHHVGALARCFDWVNNMHPSLLATNPLRKLARGYATYNKVEISLLAEAGRDSKEDNERDRRLEEGEEERICQVLRARIDAAKTADEKKLHEDALLMFLLALETAMRMRELYTLEWKQVDLDKSTLFLTRTKNGDRRQVPTTSVARRLLTRAIGASGLVFSFWSGERTDEALTETTGRVSAYFAAVFEEARCDDLHFHDTRHEATCRLVLRTRLSETQIARITGHKDPKMLRRYLSLRGAELAAELW